MVKVTLNDNLLPYGDLPSTPCLDLTQNLFLARKLCKAAIQFFSLTAERVHFRGYISENGGEFLIELWHDGKLYRLLSFPNIGYSGVLKCNVMFGRIERAVHLDVLGDLFGASFVQEVEALTAEVVGDRLIALS